MFKGIFIEEKEILKIIQNLTRQQEVIDEMFKQALTYFSDYHANCSYYIGVIQYSKGNKTEAIEYFKKFAAFKSDDQGRYPEDFSKKLG
jgi:tetratricopeptide (TPR) repeat protein